MTVDSKLRARLRGEAQAISATIHVGKSGVTPTLIQELKDQLERRRLVKVGLLKSSTAGEGPDAVATSLAGEAACELIEVRGNTAVFWKPTRRKAPGASR